MGKTLKIVQVCAIFLVFLVLGLSEGMYGPTLLDLQLSINGTINEVALVSPSQSLGHAIGAILTGLTSHRVRLEYGLLFTLVLNGLSVALVPWASSLWTLLLFTVLHGAFFQSLEIHGNLFTFHEWSERGSIITQVNYLAYAIGGAIAPTLALPFLIPTGTVAVAANETLTTENKILVQYPYGLIAIVALLVAAFFYAFGVQNHSKEYICEKEALLQGRNEELNSWWIVLTLTLVGIVLSLSEALDAVLSGFLQVFVVQGGPQLSKTKGSLLLTTYWASYAVYSIFGIVLLNFVKSQSVIALGFALVATANVILLTASGSAALYIAVVFLGAGVCPLFGLILSYTEDHIHIGTRMMSALELLIFVAESMYQLLLAYKFENYLNSLANIVLIFTIAIGTGFALFKLSLRKLKNS